MLVSGCVPSRTIQQWTPPETLSQVNAELRGKAERIYLVDGTVIRFVRDTDVRPDSVFWLDYNAEQRMSLPIEVVDFIRTVPHYHDDALTQRQRMAIRLGTGVALFGGAMYVSNKGCDSLLCPFLRWVDAITMAAGVAAAHAVAKLIVMRPRFPEEQVVYQGPIERYLQAHER
ncbi:MAG: hypothetical protein RhofKO_27210 [Rhodothermales bacterium]